MFERFTVQARQVVVLAQQEARSLGRNWVGTEHILLGLAGENAGIAATVLKRLGMGVDVLRSDVVRLFGRGDDDGSTGIPFTPRAKKVLELAMREGDSLGEAGTETEHILIALAIDGAGPAALILSHHQADLERIREEISRVGTGQQRRPRASEEGA